jgi:hypothetical protein
MGKASLDLKNVVPLRTIRIEKLLDEVKTGTLTFTANYIPLLNRHNTYGGNFLSTDDQKHSEQDILYQVSLEDLINDDVLPTSKSPSVTKPPESLTNDLGVLTINAFRCRNIRTAPNQGSKAILTPYITVEIGDDVRTTRVQKKSYGDPIFHETFNYVVRDPHSKSIVIKVKEKSLFHADKVIGEVSLSLEHIVHGSATPVEEEYAMVGEVECYIYFKLSWVGSRP